MFLTFYLELKKTDTFWFVRVARKQSILKEKKVYERDWQLIYLRFLWGFKVLAVIVNLTFKLFSYFNFISLVWEVLFCIS